MLGRNLQNEENEEDELRKIRETYNRNREQRNSKNFSTLPIEGGSRRPIKPPHEYISPEIKDFRPQDTFVRKYLDNKNQSKESTFSGKVLN